MPNRLTKSFIMLALLLSAAIFGFFYAWVCSTMWGLDRIDPRAAIEAMQGMNASVRNGIFAPAFFGTPFVVLGCAILLWRRGAANAATCFAVSGATYLIGGLILTMVVNVPMNEALGALSIPTDIVQAQMIWDEYSPKWQLWNQIRTVASGLSFLIAIARVLSLSNQSRFA